MSDRAAEIDGIDFRPAAERVLAGIADIPSVKQYYLLSRKGTLIAQSQKNKRCSRFIAYSVKSGLRLRKSMGCRGPYSIQMVSENGDVLLILPGANMIIGLLLDQQASIPEVTADIHRLLRALKQDK
jgi:predicted regulator of Ras-like GTPase activity (Roadblock/LC7/MglB family)